MLYIMVKKDAKHKELLKALDQLDHTGSMVVDRATINNEYVGEVISYNPSRLGWLKVTDPALGQKQVMFFPTISKAGIFSEGGD